MDLNTITEVLRPADANAVKKWEGVCLAGWRDLAILGAASCDPHAHRPGIIELALSDLLARRTGDRRDLPGSRTRSLQGSARLEGSTAFPAMLPGVSCFFQDLEEATVGGNIVMSLPAGPMISLAAALEGICTLWPRNGAPHKVPVVDFVTGDHANVLAPGELLRSIFLPASALKKSYAFRRFTLTHLGRSETLLIGTLCPESGEFLLTVTASTLRPVQLHFENVPSAETLENALDDAAPFDLYLDDAHGWPVIEHLTSILPNRFGNNFLTEAFL